MKQKLLVNPPSLIRLGKQLNIKVSHAAILEINNLMQGACERILKKAYIFTQQRKGVFVMPGDIECGQKFQGLISNGETK